MFNSFGLTSASFNPLQRHSFKILEYKSVILDSNAYFRRDLFLLGGKDGVNLGKN